MATFYLDLEGGNDANDGTSFANRWLTVTNGATAARIAPGDTIRIMASPTPTLLDSDAVWTANSITVTLSGAVTANIDTCETAWTAGSANVTSTISATSNREGTNQLNLAIATGFTGGIIAYKDLGGSFDFSAYEQVSLWVKTSLALSVGSLEVRLCSDTLGATPVDTLVVPPIQNTGDWHPITINKGSALGAAIQSISLYSTIDPAAFTLNVDNVLACKAVGSANSLTLNSLIGKVHNLYWVSGTAYAQNAKRKPTPPNRTGFTYKVQNVGGGTSGGSEPTWPQEIGATVVDNDITWVCEELEDTWYGIQSINGTTVKLDADTDSDAGVGRGYPYDSETVATYKFEPIPGTLVSGSGIVNTVNDSGTLAAPITFSGGWNRTDMSTQTGETWQDFRTAGNGWNFSSKNYITVDNCSGVRGVTGFNLSSSSTGVILRNSHYNNCDAGIVGGTSTPLFTIEKCSAACASGNGITLTNSIRLSRVSAVSCIASNISSSSSSVCNAYLDLVRTLNSGAYGMNIADSSSIQLHRVTASNNVSGSLNHVDGDAYLYDCLLQDATEVVSQTVRMNFRAYSHNHDQVLGAHKIFTDGAVVVTATDQRHTGSGYSWKFSLTSTNRASDYPMEIVVLPLLCKANVAHNVQIWTRRDNTSIKGILLLRGGTIAGVPYDVSVACEPAINTWVQSSALTFTPTVAGVVQIVFQVYDGVGTTNNYWIDDVSVS